MRKNFLTKKVLLALCMGSMAIMRPAYADTTVTGYEVAGHDVTDSSTSEVSITRTGADYIAVYGVRNRGYSNFILSNPVTITAGATSTDSCAYAMGIHNDSSTSTSTSTSINGDANITVAATAGRADYEANADAIGIRNNDSTNISGDASITVTATGGNATSTATYYSTYANACANGISTSNDSTSISGDANITVTATGGSATTTAEAYAYTDAYASAFGIRPNSGSTRISGDANIAVTATGGSATSATTYASAYASAAARAYGIYYEYPDGITSISGDANITVAATGGSATSTTVFAPAFASTEASAFGIYYEFDHYGITRISGDANITVVATGSSAANAYGIFDSGRTSIDGDAAIMVAAIGGNASAYGILNFDSTRISGDADITVAATGGGAASANAYAYGIANYSGTVDLERNAAIGASAAANNGDARAYSLYAQGGTININQAEGNPYTVRLTGDVLAGGSGTIHLDLNNPSSFLRGNVLTNGSGTINFTLANNAVWEPVYDNRNGSISYDPTKYAINKNTISAINLTGGIIDLTWDDTARTAYRQLDIANLGGSGGTVKIHSDAANDTGDIVNIGKLSAQANLKVTMVDRSLATVTEPTTIYTSHYSPVHVADGEEHLTLTGVTTENGAYSLTPHFSGTNLTSLSIGASSTTKAAASVTSGQAQLMQISGNHLRKRLGDLRESSTIQTGAWARTYTGEVSNDKYDKVESDYWGMQVGYDESKPVESGREYVGGAISFIRADNSFIRGSSDSRGFDFALYQTWVGEDGHYYDLIAKHGRLTSEYHVIDLSGTYSEADYHTYTDSLSAEYGYRKPLDNGWYLEPQLELTLGRMHGVNYTTSSGLKIQQDKIDRITGRMGIGVGKKLASGNHLYSSLSVLHEFNGKQRTQADSLTYSQDMGESWYEFVLGGTAKLSDHSDAYFNVEKLLGGHVSSNWQVNAGCRFSF